MQTRSSVSGTQVLPRSAQFDGADLYMRCIKSSPTRHESCQMDGSGREALADARASIRAALLTRHTHTTSCLFGDAV